MSGWDFAQAVKAALDAHAPLAALVGNRVYPLETPEHVDGSQPFVVYRRLGASDPGESLDGNSNLDEVLLELESYAPTFREAWQVADAARAAMEAWGAVWESDDDDRDDETELYVVAAQFTAWRNH